MSVLVLHLATTHVLSPLSPCTYYLTNYHSALHGPLPTGSSIQVVQTEPIFLLEVLLVLICLNHSCYGNITG